MVQPGHIILSTAQQLHLQMQHGETISLFFSAEQPLRRLMALRGRKQVQLLEAGSFGATPIVWLQVVILMHHT